MTEASTAPPPGMRLSGSSVLERLSRYPIATLFVLCFIAWLPGFFTLPPLDRDESRFAQASKQMIETGNYVDIRYSIGPRYKKPVGIYWMQAASTLAFSRPPYNEIWTYRLPSLIGGFIAVFLAYWCARAFAPPPTALIAAALIGFTVSLTAETKISKTDAVLLATVLGSQGLLMRAYLAARLKDYRTPSLWIALAGWAALAVGVLLKGPIIVAVLAVTIVGISLWDRDWKWLKTIYPIPGILVTLAIVLPWGIAIAFQSHGEFYQQSLGHDFAAKILGGQESHGAPPGYYLLLASFTLWPATLFVLPGLGSGVLHRADPVVRYLLAWAAGTWLLFEIVPTKLPHYVLPAYPAVAFLGALWALRDARESEDRWVRILRYAACVQFGLGVSALSIIPVLAPRYFGDGIDWWLAAGAGVAAVLGFSAVAALTMRKTLVAAMFAIAAAVLFYPVVVWGVAPRVQQIWMSPRAAVIVARYKQPDDPPVILAGYVEPSLIFLLGTDTRIESGKSAGEVGAVQGGLALVEDHERKDFLAELEAKGGSAKPIDELSGFNYTRGRRQHITFYRLTPAFEQTMPPDE
ncbi:MAG: glycosyltransferase family 39 protein [Proteobacteria bacterium]|nr:glycosyltransferase family 39 protein [Pseudomonadota bacterium]